MAAQPEELRGQPSTLDLSHRRRSRPPASCGPAHACRTPVASRRATGRVTSPPDPPPSARPGLLSTHPDPRARHCRPRVHGRGPLASKRKQPHVKDVRRQNVNYVLELDTFSPWFLSRVNLGRCPRLVWCAPLALRLRRTRL